MRHLDLSKDRHDPRAVVHSSQMSPRTGPTSAGLSHSTHVNFVSVSLTRFSVPYGGPRGHRFG